MTRSLLKDNRIFAAAPHGTVTLNGAGLLAGDFELALQRTDVIGNTGVAIGRDGAATGGGVFDSPVPAGPPGGDLRLDGGSITRNTLRGKPGVTVSGGGVFSTYPVDLAGTVIARNVPDQCVGC